MNTPLTFIAAYVNAWIASTDRKRAENGATATEYALIVAGIALVIGVAVRGFGTTLEAWWQGLATQLHVGA